MREAGKYWRPHIFLCRELDPLWKRRVLKNSLEAEEDKNERARRAYAKAGF